MEKIVWKPTNDYVEKANITRFMKKHDIKDYEELIKRSTEKYRMVLGCSDERFEH